VSTAPATALDRVLALTREMLAAAQRGDWDGLGRLEAVRQPLLQRHCTGAAGATALHMLHACNEQIIECVARARQQAAAEWHDTRIGHRAARDYQRVAGDGDPQSMYSPDLSGPVP